MVDGIRQKRLGSTDIVVSEMGLGTQRWGSADFNGPDEALCHQLLDRAVLRSGINLIDTAEQYPIPSDRSRPEGSTERITNPNPNPNPHLALTLALTLAPTPTRQHRAHHEP